ncbi:hypothetical protein [Marinobacterium aestuarii]|uniref:hypothetical protein n=1 Tax=Marinobacterium aestuarii TaxID=1821621 RepID=UPI000ACABB9B|nr:hypothetical protein [Marinobacterium aestuarii]
MRTIIEAHNVAFAQVAPGLNFAQMQRQPSAASGKAAASLRILRNEAKGDPL